MTLDAAAKRLYARQLLLAEVGEAGQVRLSHAAFRPGPDCDADTYTIAREYLLRAGCPEDKQHGTPLQPTPQTTLKQPSLTPAILGALLATEHIKQALKSTPTKRGQSPLAKG